jgi:Ca-activated chloride channel family protein
MNLFDGRRRSRLALSLAVAVAVGGCFSGGEAPRVAKEHEGVDADEPALVKTDDRPAAPPYSGAPATGAAGAGAMDPGKHSIALAGPTGGKGDRKLKAEAKEAPEDLGGERVPGSEDYHFAGVNPWVDASADHLSTFAIDVDTASYTIARRKILEGALPPAAAVRPEEFINYFKYEYAGPTGANPFAVNFEAAPSPFSPGKVLFRVGLQGRFLSKIERKPAHLVFLVDTSGSMSSPDKMGLVKRSLRILVDNLQDGDTVALTTYAGSVRYVLPPTGIAEKAKIHAAIEDLVAEGSTAMASGIELAYSVAAKTLDGKSNTRVIILTDGDANVGTTSYEDMLAMVKGKVSEGVFLSTIGFGMGDYKDALLEGLADKGNGNYYYVDGISAARKIFQEQLGGTLEVIAKDVKIQVDFDPDTVAKYRLIGYENRDIADVDFRDDAVDAGELGAGHRVTAVYELELKSASVAKTIATVRLRHKEPAGVKAIETTYPFLRDALRPTFAAASADFRFAVAVAAAADILRGSPHAEGWKLSKVSEIARDAATPGDLERAELVSLLGKVAELSPVM